MIRRHVVLGRAVAVFITAGLSGCERSSSTEAEPDPTLQLIVFGTVQNDLGDPVPGWRIRATAHRENDCNNPAALSGSAMTNAAGSYRMQLTGPAPAFTGCVEVWMDPFPSEGLTAMGQRYVEIDEGPAQDSIEANFMTGHSPPKR